MSHLRDKGPSEWA